MKSKLKEFFNYMDSHQYFIGNDIWKLYHELCSKETEDIEYIIDIIDSENSGLSAEDRLSKIKKFLKDF